MSLTSEKGFEQDKNSREFAIRCGLEIKRYITILSRQAATAEIIYFKHEEA